MIKIDELNDLIRSIKSQGYKYPTMSSIVQTTFSPIIFTSEYIREGEVRTYKEVCEKAERICVPPITEKTHHYMYESLLEYLDRHNSLSINGFMKEKRLEYILTIFDSGVEI